MDLDEFLNAPAVDVAKHAPKTMFWVAEGTRRGAALAGIDPLSEEYPRWSLLRLIDCVDVLFTHGVRHVFTPFLTPSHFSEQTPRYRERLFDWVALLVRDQDVRAELIRRGWQLRLVGGESLPELRETSARLAEIEGQANHTLWMTVVAEDGASWDELLAAAHRTGAQNRSQLIRALYGEDIPLATLLLSFGKPVVSMDQLLPALVGKMDCYWTQRPGYQLTQRDLRTVLYDAAFVRRTWHSDKTGRAERAMDYRAAWERGPTLGLGQRLGPHWYPQAVEIPTD